MTKLYIPQVGDQLKLIQNWDCKVFNEYRNSKVFEGLNIDTSQNRNANVDITFPKGTVLKVDRLYVRAPASSFDSITFKIEACPIKSLIKARFWVKLMDANNIDFEETKNSIETYKKLKDCMRFVSLSEGFQNSETLQDDEEIFVSKKLFEHFKSDNVIKIKFDISLYTVFKTIDFSEVTNQYGRLSNLEQSEIDKKWNSVRAMGGSTTITLNLLPVLDGFIYYYEKNKYAIEMDKAFELFEEYNDVLYQNKRKKRGSYLSYDWYTVRSDKNWRPSFLGNQMYRENVEEGKEDLEDVYFEYQGKKVTIKNQNDFDKFLKKVRKEVNTKLGV